jgi:hypothetical protein
MTRPFTPVPNVVKMVIAGTSSELRWNNVLHWVYGGAPPSLPSVSGFAEEAFTEWVSVMVPLCDVNTTVDSVTVIDLSSADSNVGVYGTATAGTRTGALLPASLAALVSYPVSLRYKGGHPRTYLFVGVQPDLLNQSQWTEDFVADINGAWSGFQGTLAGATIDGTTYTGQCAVSYKAAGEFRETPIPLPINLFNVEQTCSSQRRRMRRRT